MANATKSIFNKKATQKLRSPDDLDKFIQVASPSVWLVFLACAAILIGLFAWGIFGTVHTKVQATGVVIPYEVDGESTPTMTCFLSDDDIAQMTVGDIAVANGVKMKVANITRVPLSADEAKALLESNYTDYLAHAVIGNDWVHVVTFEGDVSKFEAYTPVPITITVDRMAPITLILGNGA